MKATASAWSAPDHVTGVLIRKKLWVFEQVPRAFTHAIVSSNMFAEITAGNIPMADMIKSTLRPNHSPCSYSLMSGLSAEKNSPANSRITGLHIFILKDVR